MNLTKVVALLTDFGLKDNYVGVMKGVILSHVPDAKLIDLTHDVPPQHIRFGAFQLVTSYKNFPDGTLFLCVVDPGVGSERKILYAECAGKKFIGPDNGLLSWVFKENKPTHLWDISQSNFDEKGKVSQTFHGRDIMAPFAAFILKGGDPSSVGRPLSQWQEIPFPSVRKSGSEWQGEILVIDSFGNLITNFLSEEVQDMASHSTIWIELSNGHAPLRGLASAYSSVEPEKLLAISGSSGFVEISLREGSAAKKTGLKEGDKIALQFRI